MAYSDSGCQPGTFVLLEFAFQGAYNSPYATSDPECFWLLSCYSPNFIEQAPLVVAREKSKVKLLLPKFHRNRTRKYYSTALFGAAAGSVSLTGRFHRHSAAGWAECTVAGPGRVRRHAAQFTERYSTPLIGHARVALSGVLTRLPSTQTDDTQRGGKDHKLLPAP